MLRLVVVLVLLLVGITSATASKRRLTCVAVDIEGIPSLICGRPARRR